MKRRDLLRAVGAAAALSIVPRNAEAIWVRLRDGHRTVDGLSPAQLALVTAMADTIIPRTDTPGASDVGVPAWVNVVVAEYYTEAERTPFLSGLDAIDALSTRVAGAPFAGLSAGARDPVMAALDHPADKQAPEARAYSRLKGLVLHGYFTSERVQKDVLKTKIMPGRFDADAPMPVSTARNGS